jgi:GTP-binding protein
MLFKQSRARVPTGQLNRMLRDAVRQNPPPVVKGKSPRLYYATQVGVQPPTIVIFSNEPKSIAKQYQRYLLNKFRDELSFDEVPIKLYLRRRHDADDRDDVNNWTETEPRDEAEHAAARAAEPADASK